MGESGELVGEFVGLGRQQRSSEYAQVGLVPCPQSVPGLMMIPKFAFRLAFG